MSSPTISIFFHNYYGHHEEWIRFIIKNINVDFNLFYNIVENSIYNLEDTQSLTSGDHYAGSDVRLKKLILRRSSNQGKDIGGKLVLLDAFMSLRMTSDYFLFLHDKKSSHKVQAAEWQKKLFRICEPDFVEKALNFLRWDEKIGLISGSDNIKNEYDYSLGSFISNNSAQLTRLQSEFNIEPGDYRYVAGTMFWARSLPILEFFRQHPPLEIRKTLEIGNIMDENGGSVTHAWERLLSWLIIAQGYVLKGV
jgi:lipopolysaccharide biosynthesis protein